MWKRKYKYSPHDNAENRALYDIWAGIKKRCMNESCSRYKDYGGRGITLCKEWEDFDVFVEWSLSNGYVRGLTIDRIDNDGNYTPDNCRWISRREQNRNKRTNVMIEYKGEKKALVDWCEELNLPYFAIQKRIKHGMDPITALEIPVYDCKTSFASLCRKHGISDRAVYDRVHKLGWDLDRALSTPVKHKRCPS